MSHAGDSASQPNDSLVPSDINVSNFSYFDEFPEFLEDCPKLFGLSDEDWNMIVDQSILNTVEGLSNIDTTEVQSTLDTTEGPSNIDTTEVQSTLDTTEGPSNIDTTEVQSTLDTTEEPSNIEAQSDTAALLQEPAPSTQVLPRPIYRERYGAPKRPTWNCYHCDACGFTGTLCEDVTRHIRKAQRRPDHHPQSVSVTWVGDDNVTLARGFISGEILSTRFQRLARKDQERKALLARREQEREAHRAQLLGEEVVQKEPETKDKDELEPL
ncbi:hypothetical protein BGX38DRAFT_1263780 [Terfezia claveryi]|nr:hypothetical protein BGX38DRAFT_1263780 [Terfezia claveryi]